MSRREPGPTRTSLLGMPSRAALAHSSLAPAASEPAAPVESRAAPWPLLRPGETCWRIARTGRAALLLDSAAYFAAAKAALLRAERSVLLIGWDFDPRTRLCPDEAMAPGETPAWPDEIGTLLSVLAERRPGLDIRVLVWGMPLALAATRRLMPTRAPSWFRGSRVQVRLDSSPPLGACHHQKLLVVDDAIAFCGGGDFATNRWDTSRHADHDPRRRKPSGEEHAPRHEVMMLVDRDAAASLGDIARARWRYATGEVLQPPPPPSGANPWPEVAQPELDDIDVGIIRTEPSWFAGRLVREAEALHLAAIAAARRFIYLENQYFAASRIAEALAARLAEPDGPEIVLVVSGRSPSWFDRSTMDAPRDALIARLLAADAGRGRFRAYSPRTEGGRTVLVHSKVAIIDDRLLRVGSANLNNRSAGYDTECDLAIEAPAEGAEAARVEAAIRRFRHRLIGHYLGPDAGRAAAALAATAETEGSLIAGIEALEADVPEAQRRLLPLRPDRKGSFAALVTALQLGDPCGPEDAWRPWRRPR